LRRSELVALLALLGGCGVKAHFYPDARVSGADGATIEPDAAVSGTGGVAAIDGPAARTDSAERGGTGGSGGGGNGGSGAGGAGGATDPRDAAQPSSGVTVSINGMAVPKEKVVVFIHIGHSDMCGRATGPANLMPFFYNTDPHLWMYAKGGSWKPAKEPTACDEPGATRAGPGMAILRTALALAPDSYVVSIGHGHSGATGGYCPNFRRAGLFYPLYMDAAKELKGKVTFGGIFTMFGITEYHLGTPGLSGLADCLVGIASEVRADLGDPSIPLMVGDWNMGGTGMYSPTSAEGKIARPQIQMVPGKDARSTIIPTDGLPMEDDRHLNMLGHKTWAERAFKLMTDKGWTPWAR
jgi:hypothetical protein